MLIFRFQNPVHGTIRVDFTANNASITAERKIVTTAIK